MKSVERNVIALLLIYTIGIGTYVVFSQPVSVTGPAVRDGVYQTSIGEILFLFTSWMAFLLLVHLRLLLLISFMGGQLTVMYLSVRFLVFGYELPNYGLIAVNGVWLLALYFYFTREKWIPDFLRRSGDEPLANQ